jgi:hypothetical protein
MKDSLSRIWIAFLLGTMGPGAIFGQTLDQMSVFNRMRDDLSVNSAVNPRQSALKKITSNTP